MTRIDAAALLGHEFGVTRHAWAARDAILYALGTGLGRDPLDTEDLAYLDERNLAVLPTFAVTLASPGMWIRDASFGVDFGKLVHSAQMASFPNPLPPSGEILGTARVKSLADRGEEKGAELVLERKIVDAAAGTTYCILEQQLLLRGDGGFGGPQPERAGRFAFSDPPDLSAQFATSPRAALIYRLSGDWNPLHLDPSFARQAGFARPILHGLASYAIAAVAVSRALGSQPASIASLSCRFTAPVTPGESLRFEVWRGTPGAHFRAFVGDRKVLDDGHLVLANRPGGERL